MLKGLAITPPVPKRSGEDCAAVQRRRNDLGSQPPFR